jgi:putative addiction module component (TIGR02574 family)
MAIDLIRENEAFDLTEAQKRELERRLNLSGNKPRQGRTWDEIKAEFIKLRASSESVFDQTQSER